jgi:hypothetical protein
MPRQIRVFLFVQEFLTEGHENRKGLFSSRTLRPSVQSERKAGQTHLFHDLDDADRWRKSLPDPPTPEKDRGRSSSGTAFEDPCRQGITNQEVIPSLNQQASC